MSITSNTLLEIDGAMGEGGGQVLRTALALSICTGTPFCINNIRAGRKKPGLRRQHLTAVRAARDISGAQIDGDEIGSMRLHFLPNEVQAGHYYFSVGTAGSTTLVLQTILYPLLLAKGESHLTLEGGTHNPFAPPFDFIAHSFLPIINQLGPTVSAKLERYGFFPKGGGQLQIHITPSDQLNGISLMARGKMIASQAKALITGIPEHVAQRELQRVAEKLSWPKNCLHHCPLPTATGPANVLLLSVESEQVTEIFTGFGQRGIRAETVADRTIKKLTDYLDVNVAVGEYLADQLLLPLALAGEGEYTTLAPTPHTLTHIEVIKAFLPVSITNTQMRKGVWEIRVK
jgi:RNA 3'-terminal phosphate cyclase (ATP)